MKKSSLLFILFSFAFLFETFAQTTTSVTLKVIDETKGTYTPGDEKVFSWVAMWSPSYVEQSNTGSWYSNFFDGYTGGKLEKTEEAWIWSYTFNAQRGGSFSWNPSIGTPGTENAIASIYGLRDPGKNIDFFVSSAGVISGEVTFILSETYTALANANGTITNKKEFDSTVSVKIIDKTLGEAIRQPIARIVNQTDPSQIISNHTDGWCYFDSDYPGGNIEKNEHEWIYSYSFTANNKEQYSWNPVTGSSSAPEFLPEKYGIDEPAVFSREGRTISGKNVLVILNESEALLIEEVDIVDYLGNLNLDNDFLHAQGRWIVDGSRNRVILRGIGLGNYHLIEPYMWGINSAKDYKSDTQSAILSSFVQLTDEETVNAFMNEYRKNYMSEADVKFLKESGFNSIRLPMHYNLFIEEVADNNNFKEAGFTILNELLNWCEKYEIYLILDMHAVPGGQSTDKAISDQYSPGLWDGNANGTSQQYQTKLIALWKEIARRYADEKWIGGYDLINEIMYYPDRDISREIRSLYERLISAIRETDKKHLIFIEGNGYANDFSGLTPPWDDNMAYSFHRYWCGNTQSSIQWMLDIRNTCGAPVWMGESGENSNTWFTEAVELLEQHEIGWAWWAYKKLDNISGLVSIPGPEGWNELLSFLQSSTDNSGTLGLTPERTKTMLMELAENAKIENAKINQDVIYALIEQPYNNATFPYGENNIPGKLYANEYDLGRNLYAYNETGLLGRYAQSDGAYNNGWLGRNDAVDMETCNLSEGNGYNIGWNDAGEWQNFTVNAQYAGTYKMKIRYAVSGTGSVTINVNEVAVLSNINLPNTGAWSAYQLAELGDIELQSGTNVIQIYVNSGFNYAYLTFDYSTAIETIKAESIGLKAIYPNPVKEKTIFSYYLSEPVDEVRFRIFAPDGRIVDNFSVKNNIVGLNKIEYNPQNLNPGIYQVVFSTPNHNSSQKMVIK